MYATALPNTPGGPGWRRAAQERRAACPLFDAGTLNQKNKNERRRNPQRDRTAPTKWEDKT